MSRLIRLPLAAVLLGLGLHAPAIAAANNIASQFPARILAAHNEVRARAGVAPLAWDPALANAAAGAREPARICGWERAAITITKQWSAAGRQSSATSFQASSRR